MHNDDFDLDAIYEAQEDASLAAEQAFDECKEAIRSGDRLDDVVAEKAAFHNISEVDLRAAVEDWAGDSVTR